MKRIDDHGPPPPGLKQVVHDKIRGLEGLENLQTRQRFKDSSMGRTLEALRDDGDELPPMSPNQKWIYGTLCRSSFFEKGVPTGERRHFSTTRRLRRVARLHLDRKQGEKSLMETTIGYPLERDMQSWELGKDDYEIGAKIGSGGMGVVHLCTWKKTGKVYALKLLKPGKAKPATSSPEPNPDPDPNPNRNPNLNRSIKGLMRQGL